MYTLFSVEQDDDVYPAADKTEPPLTLMELPEELLFRSLLAAAYSVTDFQVGDKVRAIGKYIYIYIYIYTHIYTYIYIFIYIYMYTYIDR